MYFFTFRIIFAEKFIMKPFVILTGLLLPILILGWSSTVFGQYAQPVVIDSPSRETAVVESSCQVLKEIMEVPAKEIPAALLADAQGIVVIPSLVKGGFVVGIRRGHGVVVVRDEKNGWKPPQFVTVTGGSVGWQIGIQATDLILVFKTQKSIQKLLQGRFTIGADAAAAAGPVGREAAAATDTSLNAEIYSYSRSRGIFAGISLDGSAIQIDSEANAQYYRAAALAPDQIQEIPPSAQKLLSAVAQYTRTESTSTPEIAPVPINGSTDDAEAVRRQLAESSQRLSALLDGNWKGYLALPAEVFGGERPPTFEALNLSLGRFNTVAADPRYRTLSQTREFQNTHGLLKKYLTLQTATRILPLPPPPL
jgi:lipid-binding SYLF domain-containing protein